MLRGWALPGLVLALVGLLHRRLLIGRVLAGGDLQTYFFPYWSAAVRALHGGETAFWNPYLFAGAPLLANSQVGLLYPLNWLLWLLSTPELADVTSAIHWSVLLHLALAALTAYALARDLRLSRWAAGVVGLVYAGGGFVVAHVEHLNQLQSLAWMPLLFLTPVCLRRKSLGLRLAMPRPISVIAFLMILLSGHTQMAFISLIGMATWQAVRWLVRDVPPGIGAAVEGVEGERDVATWRQIVHHGLMRYVIGFLPFAIAGLIAAAQLLPTMELASLSGRGGGLGWREAVSFSLPPWEAHRALLPPYLVRLLLPEGVAYLGSLPLLLVGIGIGQALPRRSGEAPRPDHRGLIAAVVLVGLGLFLALGGYNPLYLLAARLGMPGVVHFRAPARFLSLYVLGGALLAGIGFRRLTAWLARGLNLSGWAARLSQLAVLLAIFAELAVSAEHLPGAQATTGRAYTDFRPATATLVSATQASEAMPGRFLSISQILFEIGDRTEIETAYADTLSPAALGAYLVASKQREVLAPNLPLAFGVPAVDGYDGGLLPLRHYSTFSQLLLPTGTSDGRLRENLAAIPEARWLDLLNVQFLLTDKTTDVWIDETLYDRQFQPELAEGETLSVAWLPEEFTADALGLLYEGQGGTVRLDLADQRDLIFELPPSATTDVAHWIRWEAAAHVKALTFTAEQGALMLKGVSLRDERLDAFYPLVLSDQYWLIHSGDVKIYEDVSPPARARLVHNCVLARSDAEALELMRDRDFDPSDTLVLHIADGLAADSCRDAEDSAAGPAQQVTVVRHSSDEVVIDVTTTEPGHLLLTDAWYPGWEAQVTSRVPGESADDTSGAFPESPLPVLRADILFRAVAIEPGDWRVTLTYRSRPFFWGIGLSLLGLLLLGLYARVIGGRR